MDQPKFLHRRSTRLKGYDYSTAVACFVTLVSKQRKYIFGDAIKGRVELSNHGNIAYEEWFSSAKIRNEIELIHDEFVVMPNHIHGIVRIMENVLKNVVATGQSPLRLDEQVKPG